MTTDTVIIHNYKIIKLIGQGGFAKVYQALHTLSDRIVAIKIVDVSNGSSLRHESKVLSYINAELSDEYKHMAPTLYWYGRYGICGEKLALACTFYPFSLMEYLEDPLFTDSFQTIFREIIQTVRQIHKTGIIHCDIKPDNFMFTFDGQLALIDYGMARLFITDDGKHCEEEGWHSFYGTPKYASPFVHGGMHPCRRDDMISIGFVFMNICGINLPWSKGNTFPHSLTFTHDVYKDAKSLENIQLLFDKNEANLTPVLNNALKTYFNHIYKLKYSEKPDYDMYASLF